jgi:hypothetical protein
MMDRPYAYALQLVDYMNSVLVRNAFKNKSIDAMSMTDDFQQRECLSRRRKDNKLVLVSCSEDRAWFWKVNENGIMHFDKPLRGSRSDSRKNASRKRLLNKKQTLECLWRNESRAFLHPCDGRIGNHDLEEVKTAGKAVQLRFIRLKDHRTLPFSHHSVIASATRSQSNHDDEIKKNRMDHFEQHGEKAPSTILSSRKRLPSQVDVAHVHASAASPDQKERRSSSPSALFLPHQSPDLVAKELPRLLGYSNPILFVSKVPKQQHGSPSKAMQTNSMVREGCTIPDKLLVRKIQMNPYIASSRDERWTDPQTGLVYHTDLCGYLGHERNEVGRHTLTGVGQYTKTMLNIKVSAT